MLGPEIAPCLWFNLVHADLDGYTDVFANAHTSLQEWGLQTRILSYQYEQAPVGEFAGKIEEDRASFTVVHLPL